MPPQRRPTAGSEASHEWAELARPLTTRLQSDPARLRECTSGDALTGQQGSTQARATHQGSSRGAHAAEARKETLVLLEDAEIDWDVGDIQKVQQRARDVPRGWSAALLVLVLECLLRCKMSASISDDSSAPHPPNQHPCIPRKLLNTLETNMYLEHAAYTAVLS